MHDFAADIRDFSRRKAAESLEARHRVAFRLFLGVDLGEVLDASPERKAELERRIERLLERERLRGWRRHWSYDLNRHIALKQALNRLRGLDDQSGRDAAASRMRETRRLRAPRLKGS